MTDNPITVQAISFTLGFVTNVVSDRFMKWYDNRNRKSKRDSSIKQVIEKHCVIFVREINATISDVYLRNFLTANLDYFINLVYGSKIILDADIADLTAFRIDIYNKACDFVGNHLEKGVTDGIFDKIVAMCIGILEEAIQENILKAVSIRSHMQYLGLRDRLEEIIAHFPSKSSAIETYIKFDREYREQVLFRFRNIFIYGIDKSYQSQFESNYVIPDFFHGSQDSYAYNYEDFDEDEVSRINAFDFMRSIHRTVILGNPGAGKSTFSAWLCRTLCHDMQQSDADKIYIGTPFLVTLRNHTYDPAGHINIKSLIEDEVKSHYLNPPAGFVDFCISSGNGCVIFDGLDEITDISSRNILIDSIEKFGNVYDGCKILITSRRVGYENRPLDRKIYSDFVIAPFNSYQIMDYAKLWFKTHYPFEDHESTTKSFIKESSVASELISNPLMLGLICTLYKTTGFIPRNEVELYEKCALMLFERWDQSRKISVDLQFEDQVLPIICNVAYWMYTKDDPATEATREDIINHVSEYLFRLEGDHTISRRRAEDFVNFCSNRAWIFSDIDETEDGEPVYAFTHRTFLEYFTARYIIRNSRSSLEAIQAIIPNIRIGAWDFINVVVARIISKEREGGGDDLIASLISAANQERGKREQELITVYLSQLVVFIRASAEQQTALYNYLLKYITNDEKSYEPENRNFVFNNIINCRVESVSLAQKIMSTFLTNLLEENRVDFPSDMLLVGVFLSSLDINNKAASTWRAYFVEQLDKTLQDRRVSKTKLNSWLKTMIGQSSIDRLIKEYGIEVLFYEYSSKFFDCNPSKSIIEYVLEYILADQDGHSTFLGRNVPEIINFLKENWSNFPSPWANRRAIERNENFKLSMDKFFEYIFDSKFVLEDTKDSTFIKSNGELLFIIGAISKEFSQQYYSQPKVIINAILHDLTSILLMYRASDVLENESIENYIRECKIEIKEAQILRWWVDGEYYFLSYI